MMNQRGRYREADTPRDGRWVVTFNRSDVWSGKSGWCPMTLLGSGYNDPKGYVKPGGNAVPFATKEDAQELLVRYELLGRVAVEDAYAVRRKKPAMFRSMPKKGDDCNKWMEVARIEKGVLVWESLWVVRRNTGYAPFVTNRPGLISFSLSQVIDRAKLFLTRKNAEEEAVSGGGEVVEINRFGHMDRVRPP